MSTEYAALEQAIKILESVLAPTDYGKIVFHVQRGRIIRCSHELIIQRKDLVDKGQRAPLISVQTEQSIT